MTLSSKIVSLAAVTAIMATGILPTAAFSQQIGAELSSPESAAAAGIDNTTTGSIQTASLVRVQRIDALEDDAARQFENISADQLAAAQQELQSNPGLVSELQAKGVQLNNVVDVQAFSNGGVLVYVR